MKGSHLTSIEVMYGIAGAPADDFPIARLFKDTLSATAASGAGSINTAANIAVTLDDGHNTAAERLAEDEHRMVMTLDVTAWIDNDEAYHLELTVDELLGSNFSIYGAIINYTYRT
jgi:preprotein translocase subunit SecB